MNKEQLMNKVSKLLALAGNNPSQEEANSAYLKAQKKFGTTISDKVLVTFESRGERFVRQIHFQNGELGGADKHTMDAVHGEWKAVAWMPLPEPWKGADDE